MTLSSPVSRLNVHGDHLVLATRNCQVIICKLDGSCNVTDSESVEENFHNTDYILMICTFGFSKISSYDNLILVFNYINFPPISLSFAPGPSLKVTQQHILSFSEAFARPWALSLISVTPSSLRMEPGDTKDHDLSSILLNVGGRVLMVQRELPRPQTSPDQSLVHYHYCLFTCQCLSICLSVCL